MQEIETRIYTFASRRRGAVPAIAAAEIGFHALGVAENYLTLWTLTGAAPSFLTAFIFETTNRLITVLFKVVPMRFGVDEAGTGYVAQLLGLGERTGVAIAIIRKLRTLFWALIGGILLVREGTSPGAQLPQDQEERS